ncbi:DNA cytosine methyltransferase [Qipengyuania sp. NPDC077410]|uniref:DNA cytosine methyltransferase n=1 Tax=Qipengyuania sp. NPDC077410 TaxID=3364496 RepID=UPI0037C63D97
MQGNTLKAVSLFSGAGGMDVGFHRAGFRTVYANDIDPDACATFLKNDLGDIACGGLDPSKAIASGKGVDLVFGGPPCQGFSIAGKMDPDDERSELINTFFDVVDGLEPSAFVCENVKALAVLSRWSKVRDSLFERARKKYRVAMLVLKASDFGIPQIRERMFLIGIRRDEYWGDDDDLRCDLEAHIASREAEPKTVGQVVRELGRAGTNGNPRICKAKITFARSPILRRSPYAGMLFNGAGRPLPADGCATTLPASMGGNKTPIVDESVIFENAPSFVEEYHGHLWNGGKPRSGLAPAQLRRLTIDECLAIQTFPKGYRLAGSQSAQYRQIGNAVPCDLAEVVGASVRGILADEIPNALIAAE